MAKNKGQHGGKREGAGRKVAPHTIASEQFRKLLIEKIVAEQGPVIDKLIERAKNGSEKAIEMILERVIGRPITPLEHSGEGLEALTQAVISALGGAKKGGEDGKDKS